MKFDTGCKIAILIILMPLPAFPEGFGIREAIEPIRTGLNDVFGTEKAAYLGALKIGTLPATLQPLSHVFPWPIDMAVPERHIVQPFGRTDFFGEGYRHDGVDVQTHPGAIVMAPEDSHVVKVNRYRDARLFGEDLKKIQEFADVYLAGKQSGLLWCLAHLDINTLRSGIAEHHWFDGYENNPYFSIPAGGQVGRVRRWHTAEGLPAHVPVDKAVAAYYGARAFTHLHIQTFHRPNEYTPYTPEDTSRLTLINPLHLLAPLYPIPP